jgi:hypothetical protein
MRRETLLYMRPNLRGPQKSACPPVAFGRSWPSSLVKNREEEEKFGLLPYKAEVLVSILFILNFPVPDELNICDQMGTYVLALSFKI